MERKHRQSQPVGTGVPSLVFTCETDQEIHTFCTIGTNGTSVELKNIPELRGTKIRACCHGWVLLATENKRLWSFWNPTTNDLISLPPLPLELISTMDIRACVFTESPKKRGCKVMLFDYSSTAMVYYLRGDHCWTKHDYRRDLFEIGIQENKVRPLCEFACLNGVIYANASYSHMVAIEFNNQTGLIKLKCLEFEPPDFKMFTGCSYTFLVESFGELYAVYVFVHINWEQIFCIKVFRLDFSRKNWVDAENLDGRLLFLGSKWNCTSCLATETNGIKGNRIYFIIPEDEHLYMYDLEDGTILNSLPCPRSRLQNFSYESFWVTPEYLHIVDQVNVKPGYKISMALEQQQSSVEFQSPRNMEASSDQYPHNMQLDVFTQIASHLGPLEYLEFRATCRLFRSAAPATQCSTTSIIGETESPWLVTLRYNKSIFSFTDPIHNNTYNMKVPKALQGTYISTSKNGYLILADGLFDGKTMLYFNPFTGEHGQISTRFTYYNRLNFSSSPSSSIFLIVRMDELKSKVDYMYVEEDDSDVGDDPDEEDDWDSEDDWDNEALEGDIRGFSAKGQGVFHEGMFYFLGEKGNLGVLKDEDGFKWEVLVKPEVPCNDFQHTYLMKCNGQLMAVFLGHDGNSVKVFRLEPSEKIWVRVRSLGCYSLFISNISSVAAVSRTPGMENKIYFSRFYDQRIVYYSLQTEKFHTHGSDTVLDNFVDTKEQLYCTWIKPR